MARLTEEQLAGNQPVQIAFVVEDLEKAALHWATTMGAGPFFVHDLIPVSDVRTRDGEPGVLEQGVAVGQWGTVMVELVKVYRCEPPEVAAVMAKPGFNHVAYFAADSDAEVKRLEESGAPVLLSLSFGEARVHFHDAVNSHGFLIEQYPCIDAVDAFYRLVADAADGWDGSDPVRGPLTF
jgi:hypothetical protein